MSADKGSSFIPESVKLQPPLTLDLNPGLEGRVRGFKEKERRKVLHEKLQQEQLEKVSDGLC